MASGRLASEERATDVWTGSAAKQGASHDRVATVDAGVHFANMRTGKGVYALDWADGRRRFRGARTMRCPSGRT